MVKYPISAALLVRLEKLLRKRCASRISPNDKVKLPEAGGDPAEVRSRIDRYLEALVNFHYRQVPCVPRRVFRSQVLDANPLAAQYADRLSQVEKLLETGSNEINDPARKFVSQEFGYLFNKYKKTEFVFLDTLLYEWGIRHVHLQHEKPRDVLLFFKLSREAAHLIDIGGHTGMHDVKLLEIFDREWPNRLRHMPGIVPAHEAPTPKQVKETREAGIIGVITVNGKVIMQENFFSTARTLSAVTRMVDRYAYMLQEIEEQLADTARASEQLYNNDPQRPGPYSFRLTEDDSDFPAGAILQESTYGAMFHVALPDVPGPRWIGT